MPTPNLSRISATASSLCLLAAALLPAGCGSCTAEEGGSRGLARTAALLRDAPSEDLLSFQATMTEVRLDDDLGGTTGNLLTGNVRQEFLGLQSAFAWLSNQTLPPGNYTAVRLAF